jgi:hypothetical protein
VVNTTELIIMGVKTSKELSQSQDELASFQIKKITDLIADCNVTTPKELIIGLLHAASKLILGGSSKSKKTWVLIYLAIAVSQGISFLKWKCEAGKVLFVNFEIHEGFFRKRIIDLCNALGINPNELSNLDILTLRGTKLTPFEIIAKICEAIKQNGYVLIILDPIYKLSTGKEENASKDVSTLLSLLDQIPVTNAALVYSHHFSKGNQSLKESIDRISGSGVYSRDCDSLLTMTKHENEDCYTVDCVLRNHPEQDPFVVRWNFPLFVIDDNLDPQKLKQIKGRPKSFDEQDTFALLPKDGLKTKDWQELADSRLGVKRRTFFKHLKVLKDSNLILESKVNDKWLPLTKP